LSVSDSNALLYVVAGVALFVWWYRTRDQSPAHAADSTAAAGLRELDFVPAACDDPQHHPDRIPTSPLRARHVGLDVRDMAINGWGATAHVLLCPIHNRGRYPLDVVHVRCGRGCGTHAELDTDHPEMGIGALRNNGWCNDRDLPGDLPVCPYCAGTRSRTWR
jgi:hypothetical protein